MTVFNHASARMATNDSSDVMIRTLKERFDGLFSEDIIENSSDIVEKEAMVTTSGSCSYSSTCC